MSKYQLISERDVGNRTILNSDWSVSHRVYRDTCGRSRPVWVVVESLCNGVAERATEYRTRREALAALAAL